MPASFNARMRRLWLNIHLCIGIGAAVLLVPISLSGAVLVWHDEIAALVESSHAVTDGPARPPSALLASAAAALNEGVAPIAVRMPESVGRPAVVVAREQRRGEHGGRPRLVNVELDPATAKVLAVLEPGRSLTGLLHRFHENLTIPEYSGRSVVGWIGVAMLFMSLSGIYLWWPRNVGFLRGLRWRRGPATSFNLHHLFGFWISIPLAVVSASGVYLGFPQQARELLGQFAPLTPRERGGFNASLLTSPRLDADRAMGAALGGDPGLQVTAIYLPTQRNQSWRVQLLQTGDAMPVTVLVDDRSGTPTLLAPQQGDRIAQWLRWIHEGSHAGLLWRVLVFVCGLLPTVFVITGTMIWLRSRRAMSAGSQGVAIPQAGPAE